MKKSDLCGLRLSWNNENWVITDPLRAGDPGIKVDGAVVSATHIGDGFVDGHIVSVHGLDWEVAQHLSRQQLSLLGVGNHLRPKSVTKIPGTTGRVSLGPAGLVEVCQQ